MCAGIENVVTSRMGCIITVSCSQKMAIMYFCILDIARFFLLKNEVLVKY